MAEKQYREGDVDEAIIGKAIMWEDDDDTLEVVSAAKPLPVSDAADAAVLGTTADAAIITNTTGTISGKIRGLIALWLGGLKASSEIIGNVRIDQTTPGTTNKVVASVAAGGIAAGAKVAAAEIDGHSQTLGITTGAAVITDASGTVQQYLRGLVKLIAAKITVGIDQTTPGTTDRVTAGGLEATITVTPTLTVAGAYISGDYVGTSGVAGIIAGAARAVGLGGILESVSVVDGDLQSVAGELWIFDTAVTPPADNAAWTISDAHAATIIPGCPIPIDTYYASALNSIGPEKALGISYKCLAGSTNLYFCWVTRGAPTYVSGNLTFRFSFMQD